MKYINNKFFLLSVFLLFLIIIFILLIIFFKQKNEINNLQSQLIESYTTEQNINQFDDNNDIDENKISVVAKNYVEATITMEKDNYSSQKILSKIKPLSTESLYLQKKEQLGVIDNNKGDDTMTTGGTSTDVFVKEVYLLKKTNTTFDVVVFSRVIDKTDDVLTESALITKLEIKKDKDEYKVNQEIGEQVVNTGINGIVVIDR
ncbi:hypothetical protein [Anaerofustis butyriciformans]|uniref:hypothetical protein n=1 Tax=Anaerofustis butyriciformans TaxID=3108533 RepID=UPI002E358851|nr:hypothetical protein [Anaerofustis sp. HA2171]